MGDHVEFCGEHAAHRTCSATVRPTASGNERARTMSVGGRSDTDAMIPVSDAAPDTTLSQVAAAVGEDDVGTTTKGQAGRNRGGTKIWGSVQLKASRVCCNPPCTQRSTKGCLCDEFCTDNEGKGSGVLMRRRCFRDPCFHKQAAAAYFRGYFGQRHRKPIEWLPVSDSMSAVAPPPAVPANFAVRTTDERAKAVWGSVKLKAARKCLNPSCSRRSVNGCSCGEFSTDNWGKGAGSGVLMCLRCFSDPRLHEQAATAYFHGYHERGNRTPTKWLPQA